VIEASIGSHSQPRAFTLTALLELNALVLTEAINSRMDAYSSTIRLCASTSLELRNFGSTDLPLRQTCTSVLYSRANCEDFFNSRMIPKLFDISSVISTQTFAGQYWNENKPAELAPSGSLSCAEKENFEPPHTIIAVRFYHAFTI
jgi:hypothetical protein